jgi:phosphomannomutase
MNFVFDVDGTLTPSRDIMNHRFSEWFLEFAKNNNVYLVSGSDYQKTLEQLGYTICHAVKGVYSCAGNALYVQGQHIYSNSFELTEEEYKFLETLLELSAYPERTGQHIEMRTGLCNFSIVGRGATREQRKTYVQYDTAINERKNLAELINMRFPRLEATVAGETGIDIYLCGKDKAQIADEISPFVFFGDKIEIGGNDYSIALRASKYYKVDSWEDTFSILQKEYDTCLSV